MKIGKRTLALALVTCLLLVCAGGTSLAAADTITLTLSTPMYVEAPHRKALDALMEAYAVIAPNVKIEISGAGYSDYWSNLTSEILANNEADIMQIYPEHLSEYNTLRP